MWFAFCEVHVRERDFTFWQSEARSVRKVHCYGGVYEGLVLKKMSKPNLLPKPQMRPTTAYTPTSYNPNGPSTTSAYKPSLYTPPTTTGQPTVNISNPSLTPTPSPNPNSPTTTPKPLPTFAPRPVLQRDPTQTVSSPTQQQSPTYQEREQHQPLQHTHVQPSYTPSMPSSHTLSFAPTHQQLPSAPQHNASTTTRPTSNSNNSYQPALQAQPTTTQNSQATHAPTQGQTQGYQTQGYGASPILRPGSPTLPSLPSTPTTPPQVRLNDGLDCVFLVMTIERIFGRDSRSLIATAELPAEFRAAVSPATSAVHPASAIHAASIAEQCAPTATIHSAIAEQPDSAIHAHSASRPSGAASAAHHSQLVAARIARATHHADAEHAPIRHCATTSRSVETALNQPDAEQGTHCLTHGLMVNVCSDSHC